uniref:Uncharacterized protein n=2 Tax=unclassified Caudoviricetes TaxID=2788787 RepID=A0A8S5NI97_9CAUD|nr:MAG TPA: hypothetical protein [Siphoviridae sp. ctUF252]DAE01509.1 MAG TPA: hypothetical protein [Siphoviridae sp. ctZHt25]DAI07337.1 MAG TPA: hypothetical protein [Bacteriophage sp.]
MLSANKTLSQTQSKNPFTRYLHIYNNTSLLNVQDLCKWIFREIYGGFIYGKKKQKCKIKRKWRRYYLL